MQICFSSGRFMLVLFLANGPIPDLEPRLTKLGIRSQHFNKDTIRDLNHDSAEIVYLLPFKTLSETDWSQLRVKLAPANRFYFLESDHLSSAEVINAGRDGAYIALLCSDGDERWL